MKRKKLIAFTITLIVALTGFCGATYIGYETSYLNHDAETTFFIKKFPSSQMQFYNIYNTTTDWPPIAELEPRVRDHFADYCKYRFGITDRSLTSLNHCNARRNEENPYLFRWTSIW